MCSPPLVGISCIKGSIWSNKGICWFSAKYSALIWKSKDKLVGISIMCPCVETCLPIHLCHWSSTIKIQLKLIPSSFHQIYKNTFALSPWYCWKIVHVALNRNDSFTLIQWRLYISAYISFHDDGIYYISLAKSTALFFTVSTVW